MAFDIPIWSAMGGGKGSVMNADLIFSPVQIDVFRTIRISISQQKRCFSGSCRNSGTTKQTGASKRTMEKAGVANNIRLTKEILSCVREAQDQEGGGGNGYGGWLAGAAVCCSVFTTD